MIKFRYSHLILFSLLLVSCGRRPAENLTTEILIIGGGASGTMAGIQAARMGLDVTILEETPWLGGMITSAGVSAIDGNYRLHSGLWEEFRQNIYRHYGGEEHVKTGWVSNVLFEPHKGADILDSMVAPLQNLSIFRESKVLEIRSTGEKWDVSFSRKSRTNHITASVVIDATELGDILAMAGIPYDIGMDSRSETGEDIAPAFGNDIIQDLTYVAILKDYGEGADKTLSPPEGYDPAEFRCTCAGYCDPDSIERTLWDCGVMMNYGKLPNGYYMINWPIFGNDYYANIIELDMDERHKRLLDAKEHTLSYVYYLQHELGFRNLGLADDVYPTPDYLPFIPYHRESRRMKGLIRFTLNDLANPYDRENPLYRTGIAVGDYPVDHHHAAYPDHADLPDLHFYPVPSYTVPLGVLIPEQTEFFIVAEKSISVTNIVNGTTRLQPVCMLIGQAAGIVAALSVQRGVTPADLPVRDVQRELLQTGAFLFPFSDIRHQDPVFQPIQRIGATGILQGEGKNIGWENHTYIYPDSLLTRGDLNKGLTGWLDQDEIDTGEGAIISLREGLEVISRIGVKYGSDGAGESAESLHRRSEEICNAFGLGLPALDDPVDRKTFAVLLDRLVDPFSLRGVDHAGHFMD